MRSRIIITNNFWYLDEAGGSYKISTDFAAYLSGKGHEVHYVCLGKQKSGLDVNKEMGVSLWRYPKREKNGRGKRLSNYFYHLAQSGEIAQKIIHASVSKDRWIINGHSGLQYLGVLKHSPKRMISRSVMSVHSPMEEEYRSERMGYPWALKDFITFKMLSSTERRCYTRSDVIQCDSHYTKSLLQKKISPEVFGRSVVCPGYVDADRFSLSDTPKQVLKQLMAHTVWASDDTVFFCLRRHEKRMGIDNLIRGAAWLREKIGAQKRFRVIIGGDGPERPALQKLTREINMEGHVFFLGKVAEADLPIYYQAADCFILPTRSLECFGLIILESFACGTPVIATPVGAIPEVLGGFATESLASGIGPEEIGKAMLAFLEAPRTNHLALRRYAESFDKEKILARLENIVLGKSEEAH